MTPFEPQIGTVRDFPRHKTVLDLFHDQVAAGPDRVAVRHRDRVLTYAEVDALANAVAARLVSLGVARQGLVPVMVDGGVLPSALLGVMKAGAVFVPVDPGWPPKLLREILSRLDPRAVLTHGELRPYASVSVDGLDADDAPADTTRYPGPTDLIYGYFTSGSTGVPKCALNIHRGLVNRLTAMSRRFGDGAEHITLQNSRVTFDSAVWQMFWPLTSGGQVVFPHRDSILDLEETIAQICRYRITATDFVPTVMALFVSLIESRPSLVESLTSVRRILVGGEAANAAIVHRLRELLSAVCITNTYGPTECSIGSVFHDVTDDDRDEIPLGRPIDNTCAIVLDDDGAIAAREKLGEIYLAGECLGAGYLDDPERTREVFVPNRLPGIPGERLYRTGDLGWWDESGRLRFAGRRDDQVQVGGVRVELGEIDAVLASYPLVGDVRSVTHGTAEKRILVSCVVPRTSGEAPDPAALRRYAKERLPADAVPHRVIIMDSLPVNRSGKVDRAALAETLAGHLADARELVASATAEEALIARLWCEVLERDEVSVTTPFVDLGGTSLTAWLLLMRLNAETGARLSVSDLLATDTVRGQAALLAHPAPARREETERLAKAAQWGDELVPVRGPTRLLLTGATGFIGAHLAVELLADPTVELECLIRGADIEAATARFAEAMRRYRLDPGPEALGRLRIVTGDLRQPLLGLGATEFACLGGRLDGIVHAGGLVNLLTGYTAHEPVNVFGLRELARLSVRSRSCPLHVLSTLSVFPPGAAEPVPETRVPSLEGLPADGYSRSKLVAERLLAAAADKGVSSVVYRLGEVWPHRATGAPNPRSLAHNLMYAAVRCGCVFGSQIRIDVIPVDVVAGFIAASIRDVPTDHSAYHLVWPDSLRLTDAFDALSRRVNLDCVDYPEFRSRVTASITGADADAAQRLSWLAMALPDELTTLEEMFTDCTAFFDTRRFRWRAEQARLSAPSRTPPLETLAGYVDVLVSAHPSRAGIRRGDDV